MAFSFEARYDVAFAGGPSRHVSKTPGRSSRIRVSLWLFVGREVWWFTPFISGVSACLPSWCDPLARPRRRRKTMGEPVIRVELRPGDFAIVTCSPPDGVLAHGAGGGISATWCSSTVATHPTPRRSTGSAGDATRDSGGGGCGGRYW
jgi:hypothetical protein